MSEEQSQELEKSKTEKPKKDIRYHIHPTHFFSYDDDERTWELEINLPGIKKENVDLKFRKDAFQLLATRDNAQYHLEECLPFDIKKDSIEAEYRDGLLYVKGKLKDPMEDAVEIKL